LLNTRHEHLNWLLTVDDEEPKSKKAKK
jgi:hypothetical protein